MSKGFSINDILGNTKANAPAGQKMQVVMLPEADIEPNPENSIYEIGDVSMLKADIAERGLRSPLEVLPAQNGKYMLLAGHRRWTACRALTAEGVAGFEVLPCVIRQSQGEDDDLIALITSNATARELTDGERLRQYRALKQALERKKAAGALDGRIRDEMSRITGDGTGTLGRLNAIANNCVPEVLAMVERGEITMTRAYECSKLYKVQQVEYAKIKYASMPPITDMARRAAIKYLVKCGLADQLKKLDYVRNREWNYADRGLDARKLEPVTLDLTESETDALLRIEPSGCYNFRVRMLDPADSNEVIAESSLTTRDLFDAAKRLYINRDDLAAYKAEVKGKRDQERARQELEAFDSWPLVTRLKELGLTIRERKMADGGRLIIAVDDLTRFSGHVDGFQYRECFAVRFGPNGERAGRDGDINALEWYKRWYSLYGITLAVVEELTEEYMRKYNSPNTQEIMFRLLVELAKQYETVRLVLNINGKTTEVKYPVKGMMNSDILYGGGFSTCNITPRSEENRIEEFIANNDSQLEDNRRIPIKYIPEVYYGNKLIWKNPNFANT